jgi:hypothetical protein
MLRKLNIAAPLDSANERISPLESNPARCKKSPKA